MVGERLDGGASIEAIAREAGRDPSTVSYWARKHGLTSSHAPRHAARGGDRARAARRGRRAASSRSATWPTSSTAARRPIRHWLRRHAARRPPAVPRGRRGRRRRGRCASRELRCPRHGMTRHVRRDGRLSVRAMSRSSTSRTAAPQVKRHLVDGGRRSVRAVRLRPLPRRPAVPSRRSAPRSASRSAARGSRARSPGRARRRRNACCCARTAMPRSRAGLSNFP